MSRLKAQSGNIQFFINLNTSAIAEQLVKNLPFTSQVKTWGDEIYFKAPVKVLRDDPVEILSIGDVGFWHEGGCVCIFFGKTPLSGSDNLPKPANPVDIIGEVETSPAVLRSIRDGNSITLTQS